MMFSFQAGSASTSPQWSQQLARDAGRGSRPKRAKVSIACNFCKARKTKCDGARPVCGPCAKRKQASQVCKYREGESVSSSRVHFNPTEETRINTSTPQQRHNRTPSQSNSEDDPDRARSRSPTVPSGSLFGAPSGANLLHDVEGQSTLPTRGFEPIGEQPNHRIQPKPLKELPRLQKRDTKKQPSDVQFAIPPRKVADHLLGQYWDFVDNAYPWLDRASIESAYETLWSQKGEEAELAMDERTLHCILNLMFACSCVVSQGEPLLSRYQSSVVFFDRAQELMSYGLMEIYNFEIIQILLLTAVYLQHDKVPQKCFRNIATAIHIAQELGLHVPEIIEAISNSREQDLARQVWYGCVIMDRICSMTFGCALKVPQSLAKQGLSSSMLSSMRVRRDTESAALPSKVNFYVSFYRLHHIIGEVLEIFYISRDDTNSYHNKDGNTSAYFDQFASLFRIESELNDWAADLHPFFQMPSDVQDTTPTKHITREANILRARYLSVRLLLFRPFLQTHQTKPQTTTLNPSLYMDDPQTMPSVVRHCQLNCVKAAGDMIEFISRNLPGQTQAYILPSNWYTVSYIYMAVTILLAAKTSQAQQLIEHLSTARLNSLLHYARDILKNYESDTVLALRCSSVLKLIDKNIDMRRGRSGTNSVPIPVESGLLRGTAQNTDNNSVAMQVQGQNMSAPGTQDSLDNLAWLNDYVFDWNDWPTFFAQLDDEATPIEDRGMQA